MPGERVTQRDHGIDVRELLVAVERDGVFGQAVEDRRDIDEPREVAIEIAAQLDLEIAVAVSPDDLLERDRKPVRAGHRRTVAFERIGKADRVSSSNAVTARQAGEEGVQREA